MRRSKVSCSLASPLARHPGLLLRKVRDRLLGPPRFRFEDPPAGLRAQPPAGLAEVLRSWAASSDLTAVAYPGTRVFRQDFTSDELLQLCRSGPRAEPGLRGDIKLPWEFSRGQAFTLNAARGLADPAVVAAEINTWLRHNEDPDGVNWTNAMEVALRAVNWICADALLDGALGAAVGEARWISNLWNSGRAIFQRLETRLLCSNHYLADLLGLRFIGAALGHAPWIRFAEREFPRALRNQTFPDGGLYEASLPYHALVTEMALLFGVLSEGVRPQLPALCQVLADGVDVDGDVFPVGDHDGGRVIPFDFVSRTLGRARVVLKLAGLVTGQVFAARPMACYPDSGWWMARQGDWNVLLEFGGVGMAGLGSHAHNDDLSICADWRGQRILVDPGSYLYTSAPGERNRLRSIAAHNSLSIDGAEPRAIPAATREDLFSLPGDPRPCKFELDGEHAIFAQRDFGAGLSHARGLEISSDTLVIEDEVRGEGTHEANWRWLLAPGIVVARLAPGEALLQRGERRWLLAWGDTSLRVECVEAPYSPFYGQLETVSQLSATVVFTTARKIRWELRPC